MQQEPVGAKNGELMPVRNDFEIEDLNWEIEQVDDWDTRIETYDEQIKGYYKTALDKYGKLKQIE